MIFIILLFDNKCHDPLLGHDWHTDYDFLSLASLSYTTYPVKAHHIYISRQIHMLVSHLIHLITKWIIITNHQVSQNFGHFSVIDLFIMLK